MFTNTRKLQLKKCRQNPAFLSTFLGIAFICLGLNVSTTFAQEPEPPKVCISQAAANQCAANARELPAVREKNAVLEAALLEKDKSIAEIREAARKNEADLKEALVKTQSELAVKTGQLIGAEAMVTRLTAIIDFMLKNGRQKCNGVICVQF